MYSAEQKDKIGNTLIFLANKFSNLSKTKAIKLLYILDEFSIRKSGIPFLNLEYKVWKFGPVPNEIYVELSSQPTIFKNYITRQVNEAGHEIILPNNEFVDDEFSQNDTELLEFVCKEFANYTRQQLIDYTHRVDSPWYNVAKEKGVLNDLLNDQINTTDYIIDLSELVKHDPRKLGLYSEYKEYFN